MAVPRLIESLQKEVERVVEREGKAEQFRKDFGAAEGQRFLRRWWRFRRIHRLLGWKFWAFISGGAALPSAVKSFWNRLGFAVIQGYGMTETTALISLNHPFRSGKGSIGKLFPGLEMKLSPSGEILVRGENIAAGYLQRQQLEPSLRRRRLVPHGRRGRNRRGRPSLFQRPGEKRDRHARSA